MHHPCKFYEGKTSDYLVTGPAPKPLPGLDANADAEVNADSPSIHLSQLKNQH